jgi:putative DNA primase/helicase
MVEVYDFFTAQLERNDDQGAQNNDRPLDYTDEALALRFSMQYAQDLRYVSLWGQWLGWNGQRWQPDDTLQVMDFTRSVARAASAEIMEKPDPNCKLAATVASAKTIAAIERLARADRRHALRTEDWDANAWLLNTPDGTVDLSTGCLRPHERGDYCTKLTAVSPAGQCHAWIEFLNRVFNGDRELIGFCQRMLGYSLTGSIRDHALFFLYGTGGNGKGVFLNTWHGIMGSYATIAPMETFTASQTERHPTDLAMLRGARVVMAQETEEGHRWAESRIKAMTGGDPVTARFMRQDFFTYQPQFKLMIAGNHKPSLRNVDEAMRRRFNLIPFTVTIPKHERDPALQEKLKAEWPGILQWAIEGCLAWLANGLQPPDAVRLATEDYLAEEDTLQKFLDEKCCKASPSEFEEVSALFAAWRDWCNVTGEYSGSIKRFSQNLLIRRFMRVQHPDTRRACIAGLKLIAPHQHNVVAD